MAESADKGAVRTWMIRFWVLAVLFYFLDQTAWFQKNLVALYARCSTRLAGLGLTLIGVDCHVGENSIAAGGRTFTVAGSIVFLIFTAMVLTFPASWKKRLTGVLFGFVSITTLNILRIILIVLLGSRFPATFWEMHIIFGQALIIAGTLATFIWWARDSGRRERVFPLSGRGAMVTAALFGGGFIFSYLLYYLFLDSPLGEWFRCLVVSHAAGLLGLFASVRLNGELITTAHNSIRVVHSCLASPVLVLILAAIFLLPLSWPRRLLLYALGFFPLYYLYHLLRTIVLVWFLHGDRSLNFAYNTFGQLILIMLIFGASVFYWGTRKPGVGIGRQSLKLLAALFPALLLALSCGWFWRAWGISRMFFLFGIHKTLYDPGRVVSMMPVVQVLIWVALVLSTPDGRSWARRLKWSAFGVLFSNLFFVAVITGISLLGLTPHHWLLKFVNIGLPTVAYFCLARSWLDTGPGPEPATTSYG